MTREYVHIRVLGTLPNLYIIFIYIQNVIIKLKNVGLFRNRKISYFLQIFNKIRNTNIYIFIYFQYMGSFPVAIPDVASRAEFVRSQLETLRVSTFPYYEMKKKGKKKRWRFSSGRMKLENLIGRLEKAIVFSINFLVWLCCDPKLFSFDYRQVAYTRDKIDYSSTLRCIIRINKIPG